MDNQLKKRYGLPTAIAMVVGIVIGSGVFFKAEVILKATGGNLPIGILAWIIGGVVMVTCAYMFSIMAQKFVFVSGIVDYAEAVVGKGYAYMVGWFMATIYYPTLTGVLAWLSARYTCIIFGYDIVGGESFVLAGFFLIMSYAINTLSPVLAGKLQVSTTAIKLVPLILMAVVGTIKGFSSGLLLENFSTVVDTVVGGNPLFRAIVATCFAYEGWVVATTINAELKDPKKTLSKALVIGSLLIVSIYLLYYTGLAGAVSNAQMMESGETAAKLAFQVVFSKVGGTLIFVFVIVSCLGTLNGLMMGATRGIYALAVRNVGPKPQTFKQVDSKTNMPTNSAILGLVFSMFWLAYFYGANLHSPSWFGFFSFDTSELPIVTSYSFYLTIFIMFMVKQNKDKNNDLHVVKRTIIPIIASCCCLFMIVAAVYAHGMKIVAYLIVFAVIMFIGYLLRKEKTDDIKNK